MNQLQLLLAIVLVAAVPSALCCRGCTDLDDLTFTKVIKKFKYTLLKFDVAFPYGEKFEAYQTLAGELNGIEDLLVATVGIKDYGEKDNAELGEKYGAKEPFPVIKLFKDGSVDNPIDFGDEVTVANLKTFLRQNTGLYIGLVGCLENFDKLAAAYIQALPNAKAVHTEAEKQMKALEPEKQESAKVYLMIMSRIEEKGETFVLSEKQRIANILKTKLSDKKRAELTQRQNILESFKRPVASGEKSEL